MIKLPRLPVESCIRNFNYCYLTTKIQNPLPFWKFYQKLANRHKKRSSELYCLFIAADSIVDAINFIRRIVLLTYCDAVGWVFRPVKPTTESENRLQLDSVSTSVSIDRLAMVDNTSAVGKDSRPWVVPQSLEWLSTITRERQIPPDSESGGIPHLFQTSLSPHKGRAWRARHDNNNNNNNNNKKTHCSVTLKWSSP